jgi:glycosyltransferase involved in cell wall biosynthesis
MRTVLLIAFHFPPYRGSSGLQRTLRFAQHLPNFGWRPIVLTAHPFAYEATAARVEGNELPAGLAVHRAFGLDTARHLSFFGRYPEALALPDRWASWRLWAVPKALRIIRRERVDAVWTTFPITTAHQIGLEIKRRRGLPWIAEFRDPMWQHDWPPEPKANAVWRALEQRILRAADRAVFTAPSAAQLYAERFDWLPAGKLAVIENGYDEEIFRRATASLEQPTSPRPVTLLHSGIIYRSERDPTHLFAAIAQLKSQGAITPERLRIVLRASGSEGDYQQDLQRLDIADIVRLEPPMDYALALQEMLTADGLLLLQAANCNAQVPAKLYEYLRARRPLLALTDPDGDTARAVRASGGGLIARLDSTADITAALTRFLTEINTDTAAMPSEQAIASCSREARAGELAHLLDTVSAAQSSRTAAEH